jgi:hypothetical protein
MTEALYIRMALELMPQVVYKQVLRIQNIFTLPYEMNANRILTRWNRHYEHLMQLTVNKFILASK